MSPIINPTVEGKPEAKLLLLSFSPFSFDFSSRQNILFGQRNFHDSMNGLSFSINKWESKIGRRGADKPPLPCVIPRHSFSVHSRVSRTLSG